jgi:hypothetical protein
MRGQYCMYALGVCVCFACFAEHLPAQQSPSAPKKTAWELTRTPDGQPDFQGFWATSTRTPLERPPEFAGKEFLTEQEAADYEKRIAPTLRRRFSKFRNTGVPWTSPATGRGWNKFEQRQSALQRPQSRSYALTAMWPST